MMGPCERFEELWLDYLYALCDEDQRRELEGHLPLCPTCQGALAEAKACQHRLAVAARAIAVVPEFTQPQDELAPLSLVAQSTVAEPIQAAKPRDERRESRGSTPAPTLQLKPRRSLARRLWPVWSAAAALLIGVIGLTGWHRQGLRQHDQAVAQARREVDSIEARLEQLRKDADRRQEALEAEADVQPVRVAVLGPAATQPGAPFTANVSTRGPDGRPQSAELEVKVLRESGEVVHHERLVSKGAAQVAVPAGWKANNLRLEVLAKNADAPAVAVRETVQVQPASHVLHLAANKSVFQPGEVIFLRALALEQYSLKPAQHPLPLRFALVDSQGREMLHTTAATGPGGIASAGLAIVPSLPPGHYSVEAAGPGAGTQRRPVEVVSRLPNIEVFADRDQYRGGEQMNLTLQVRAADGKPAANQEVEVHSRFSGSRASLAPPVTARTGPDGRAKVEVPLPATVDGAAVDVEVQTRGVAGGFGGGFGGFGHPTTPAAPGVASGGARNEKKKAAAGAFRAVDMLSTALSGRRSFPVVPSRLEIDFYPEGGDLLAGVEQRVYYRVRSPLGEPVRPEGRVIVLAGNETVYTSEPGQGIGMFRLRPDPKQRYRVRLAGPMSVTEIRDPFKGLGIQADGIALTAGSVVEAGASLAAVVRNRGPARQVALVVQCRGQLVTQQIVEAAGSPVKVRLDVPAEVAGVLRLTAYELRDGRLEPRAERLVYRAPGQRLDFKVALRTQKDGQAGGKGDSKGANATKNGKATLAIEARNEAGRPASAWAAAVVAEDRHRAEASELSLAQHFLIAEQLGQGADVHLLAGLADDGPEARATLDLLLGVHGWRRFVPRGAEPVHLARQDQSRDAADDRAEAAQLLQSQAVALFHNESGAEARAVADAKRRVQTEIAALQQRTDEAAAKLQEEQTAAAAVLAVAQETREAYARLPGEYYRLGLGVLAAAAFAAACLLMLWGLVRAARRRGPAAPPFAGAIAALAVCLALYVVLGPGIRVEEPAPRPEDPMVAMRGQKKKVERPPTDKAPAAQPGDVNKKDAQDSAHPRDDTNRSAPHGALPAPDARAKSQDADSAPAPAARAKAKVAPAKAAPAQGPPPSPSSTATPPALADKARPPATEKALAEGAFEPARQNEMQQNTFQQSAARRDQPRGMFLPLAEQMDRARGGNAPGGAATEGAAGYADDRTLTGRYAAALKGQTANLDALRTMPMMAGKGKKAAAEAPANRGAPAAPGDVPAAPPSMLAPGMPNVLTESGAVAREFAYRRSTGIPNPPTLLWHPALRLPDGRAQLEFDLPPAPSTYRILIYGHTEDGRLGFFEDRLNTAK